MAQTGNTEPRQTSAGERTRPAQSSPRGRVSGAQQLSRGQQRRRARQQAQRPWWRGPIPLIGIPVLVIVVIAIYIFIANQTSSSANAQIGQPVSATILHQATDVPPSVLAAVGSGIASPIPLRKISGPPLQQNGKPEVLYIGADYCPHCAAIRWSLLNALSRFGTFSNLTYMRSAESDGNIATVTFHGSSYTSKYISLVALENEDRNGQAQDSLTSQQQQLLSTLGNNGYPFLDIAGVYANDAPGAYAEGFDYSVLSGKDWTQIANALSNPASPITRGIIGNANYETAAICMVTHNQPASACNTATIQRLQRQLPTHP